MAIRDPLNNLVKSQICRSNGVVFFYDVFERAILDDKRWVRAAMALTPSCRALKKIITNTGVAFVHVPRCAGTSVSQYIYSQSISHRSIRIYKELFFDEHLPPTIAIMRDPEERFLSAFKFVLNGGGHDVPMQADVAMGMQEIRSMDDLISYIERSPDLYHLDHVLRPQHWYITDKAGAVAVDALLVAGSPGFEAEITNRLQRPTRLQRINQTPDVCVELSEAARSWVRAFYARDYEILRDLGAGSGGSVTAAATLSTPRNDLATHETP